MSSLFHIFIKPRSDVTDDQVKEKMNLALDWYKYSDYCWMVKTTSDAAKWQIRLKPLIDEKSGALLILPIDTNQKRQGWMVPSFWKWLRNEEPVNKKK